MAILEILIYSKQHNIYTHTYNQNHLFYLCNKNMFSIDTHTHIHTAKQLLLSDSENLKPLCKFYLLMISIMNTNTHKQTHVHYIIKHASGHAVVKHI